MDSNCVNNYLGHAPQAKCWHSLHIPAARKGRQGNMAKPVYTANLQASQRPSSTGLGHGKKSLREAMAGMELCMSC